MSTEAYVRHSIRDGIAAIEFFHPQSNSLPSALLRELARTITEVGQMPEARVIVLQSAGNRAFCAGASFDELTQIQDGAAGLHFFSGFAEVINAMRMCPRLIIARVQGKAVGGGVGLAAAADYAVGTDEASIKLSELAVGIGPFVVGPAVERKMGVSAFSQLAIDAAEWRSADWAARHGLYAEVHSDVSSMDEGILKLATRLSGSSLEAMAELKKIFWQDTGHWADLLPARAAISGRLVLSDYTRNAIASFKSR